MSDRSERETGQPMEELQDVEERGRLLGSSVAPNGRAYRDIYRERYPWACLECDWEQIGGPEDEEDDEDLEEDEEDHGNSEDLQKVAPYWSDGGEPTCDCIAPPRCPNFEVCGKRESLAFMDCHGGMCQPCNMQFAMRLQQRPRTEECAVCKEEDFSTEVLFPGCNHHWFCPSCIRRLHPTLASGNSPCPLCRHHHVPWWVKERQGT